jgi:hypothetical protein
MALFTRVAKNFIAQATISGLGWTFGGPTWQSHGKSKPKGLTRSGRKPPIRRARPRPATPTQLRRPPRHHHGRSPEYHIYPAQPPTRATSPPMLVPPTPRRRLPPRRHRADAPLRPVPRRNPINLNPFSTAAILELFRFACAWSVLFSPAVFQSRSVWFDVVGRHCPAFAVNREVSRA